jgi:hypothetical protein
LWVITNRGDDGVGFINECRAKMGVLNPILVWCGWDGDWNELEGVTITTAGDGIEKFVREVVLGMRVEEDEHDGGPGAESV